MFLIFGGSSGKGELLLGGVSKSMSAVDSASSSSRFLRNREGVKKYFFQKRVKKITFFGEVLICVDD